MPATYPPAGQVTWVAGQRLDAADLNPWPPPRVAWGIVDEAEITADSSGTTSTSRVDVTGLSVTFTAVADRLYQIEADLIPVSSASGDRVGVTIADGSDNVLRTVVTGNITGNDIPWPVYFAVVHEPGAGSVTYKIQINRISGGSGTVSMEGTPNSSAIRVFDVGPAS